MCTPEDIRSEGNTNEGEEIDEYVDEEVGNDGKKISRIDGEEGGRD